MIRIQAMQGVPIKLGRLGENDCRGICFPELSGLLEMYPDADVTILNCRPTDPDAYPVNPEYIDIDDGEICWRVQSGDLAYVGKGQCEVIISKDPVISKSFIYDTEILEALDGSGDPPDPWTSWQQDVIENANRAEAAAELLENPGAEAVTLAPGTPASASYDNGTFTFGIPQGQQGRPGDPGAPGKDGDDYVITEDDYAEIADDVVKSQGLQRIVTEATDAADLARGYADGKHLDGSPNSQLSENNAEFFASQAAAKLAEVNAAGETKIAAIQAKGAEVLESIPDDYTELSEDVDSLKVATNSMPPIKESDTTGVDLDVSDPEGNVIVRFQDGHIKVKNFDSEDVEELEETVEDIKGFANKTPMVKNSSATGVDLDISDNAGNVIVRLQDGHIKVKNFDSSEIAETISGIEEEITEIEEAITPSAPTSVTVDNVSDLLDEIANGETDIILIKNGTYNVLNVEVYRNVQIIGESRTGVILNCDGTTDLVNPVTDRHGIRFRRGGALKNLTFNVNDVKYVMHQDVISVPYDLLIENCTFNRYDDSCGYYFFIGCGCYGTQNITARNCSFIFSENTHNRVSYGFFWHNWHLAKSQLNALAANVTMENCGCVGCGMIIIQDIASKNVNDIISVLNCCSTESAPISSGANGYYLDVPNADVPYNVLFIINNKIGDMILQDRSADKYKYLGAVVTNFTT